MTNIMNGFTFFWNGKDYFVVTEKKNKTDALIAEIVEACNFPTYAKNDLRYRIQKAIYEIKTLSNGRQMYEISGEDFGGCGHGAFVNDGKTVIVNLSK